MKAEPTVPHFDSQQSFSHKASQYASRNPAGLPTSNTTLQLLILEYRTGECVYITLLSIGPST
jgi:hypothetical protein